MVKGLKLVQRLGRRISAVGWRPSARHRHLDLPKAAERATTTPHLAIYRRSGVVGGSIISPGAGPLRRSSHSLAATSLTALQVPTSSSSMQSTDILRIDLDASSQPGKLEQHPAVQRAVATLRAGDVVAIPTETVYGLAANALSASAVGRIYAAKNRPSDNPLIIHISSLDMLAGLYPAGWELPPIYEQLARDLWPGPLTILVPRSPLVPDAVTCGLPTMAVRMPAHPVALALIAACGFPLAAPSANSSGRPSPTLASHVLDDLGGRIPLVLDGGPCTCGVESTVLDGLRSPPAILRPGGVTREQLVRYPGLEAVQTYRRDFVDEQLEAAPTTPGMKYRHYSPNAQVLLVDPGEGHGATDAQMQAALAAATEQLLQELRTEGGQQQQQQQQEQGQGQAQVGPELGQGQLGQDHERPPLSAAATQRVAIGVCRTSLPGASPGLQAARSRPRHAQPDHDDGSHAQRGVQAQATGPGQGLAGAGGLGDGCSNAAILEGNGNGGGDGYGTPYEQEHEYEYVLGHVSRPEEVAVELFRALRTLDGLGVRAIVVEGVRDEGAGVAVMNRLRKAASRVVRV